LLIEERRGVSGTYKFGSEIDITAAMTLAFRFYVLVFPEDSSMIAIFNSSRRVSLRHGF
jgi:hypothetical protein